MLDFIGLFEVFLCVCVLYYFFSKERTADMVDIISTRLQEVYGSFRFPNVLGHTPEEHKTVEQLQRYGQQQQKRRTELKNHELKAREQSLFNIKEKQSFELYPENKPISGLACRHCVPDSKTQLDPKDRRRDVKDILRITQHAGRQPNSTNWDWGVWCPHLAQVVRLHKFPYPQVSGAVLRDDNLITAIDQTTKDSINEKQKETEEIITENSDEYHTLYEKYRKQHEKRAKNVLIDMRSKISDLLLRLTSWVLYKLLPCFLSGVAAHPAQIDMLKAATEKSPGAPLIFLPLHRSHLDYILISFILLNNDIRSPIVAAGNNLRIPFFGALLRGLGAFFIKRKIDPIIGKKDLIYRAILHTYLKRCLSANHNVEFFIEGGRTRTGKPCMPKSGILSVIVDAFMEGTISDALLVPVSVNYERLVDGHFIYEQLGQKKQPESFRSAISAIWNVLHSKYGLMRIDFNEPFSIRELVKAFNKTNELKDVTQYKRLKHNPSSSSLYGTDIVQEEHRTLIDSIARHVIYDCASATSVMTTNAIAFLLLTRFRDGVTMNVFAEALDELRNVLKANRDIGFTGLSTDVINYAVNLLGPGLIVKEKRGTQVFIKPVTSLPNVIELSYYSNSMMPHFALESIVATALDKTLKETEEKLRHTNMSIDKIAIDKDEVMKKCYDHCEILKNEFIFCKPCQKMEEMLEETILRLRDRLLIIVPEVNKTTNRDYAFDYGIDNGNDDYEDEEENRYVPKQYIYLTAEGHCDRLLLVSVLAPIGHTYLSVTQALNNLLGNAILETEFIKICINDITLRVNNGECKYGESISVDSIKNCLKLLEKWKVINISNTSGMRLLTLDNLYNSSYGVDNIIERIRKTVPFV